MSQCCGNNGLGPAIILVLFINYYRRGFHLVFKKI